MAIPKGEFFKDKVEQGRYGPIFPKSPAWLYDHREDRAGTRGGYPRLWEDDRRNDRRCATLGAYITHFCCRSRSRGFVSCGANAGFGEPQRLLGICGSKPIVRLEYMVGVFNCADRQSAKGRQINYCEWRGILISWVIQQRCEKGKPCASARSSTSIFVRIGFYPRSC